MPIEYMIFEMYLNQNTMSEIICCLNQKQVKPSRGYEYNKNSLRNIPQNPSYKDFYIYRDIKIPDGMPPIVDDKTFVQAQSSWSKKAPARSKAIGDSYILITKLFCGECGAAEIGYSGCHTLPINTVIMYIPTRRNAKNSHPFPARRE